MKYFAMIKGRQVGPAEIDHLAEQGLMPDTYVWCKGMDDWKKAREVGDICRYFRNRIFDKMHPSLAADSPVPAIQAPTSQSDMEEVPIRFRRFVERSEESPTILSSDADLDTKPSTWFPFPIIFAILLCPPLGIAATLCARSARKQWKEGLKKEAHESARQAKMYGGVGLFIGLILISALIRFL